MQQRRVRFFADRLLLDGDLYLPDDAAPGAGLPAVISCSGYQGLKDIHPARFARSLVPHGYACLAFDYRGFGASEGERGRLTPQDWAEDVRAAVSFMETVPEVDPERIGLIGWGLGGGVVVAEAAEDDRVRAVACLNGIADGERSTRLMHDDASWESLVTRIAEDRRQAATTGRSEITSPWDIVRLDLDNATDGYVAEELYKAPGFGSGVTLQSAEQLLRFRPEEVVDRISPRPLLVIHGDRNGLHKPEEAQRLHDRAREPKQLVLLEGAGHTEWMFDDHPTYQRVAGLLVDFLGAALGAAQPAAAS
jgi:pimeloyl-ACP methyl ester carboxylesterase